MGGVIPETDKNGRISRMVVSSFKAQSIENDELSEYLDIHKLNKYFKYLIEITRNIIEPPRRVVLHCRPRYLRIFLVYPLLIIPKC